MPSSRSLSWTYSLRAEIVPFMQELFASCHSAIIKTQIRFHHRATCRIVIKAGWPSWSASQRFLHTTPVHRYGVVSTESLAHELTIGLFQAIDPLVMKQFTIAVIFFVSFGVAWSRADPEKVICGGFRRPSTANCLELLKTYTTTSNETLAPVTVANLNGKAFISSRDCAIVITGTLPAEEGPGLITAYVLASLLVGEEILRQCSNGGPGYVMDSRSKKTCMMNTEAYVIFFFLF